MKFGTVITEAGPRAFSLEGEGARYYDLADVSDVIRTEDLSTLTFEVGAKPDHSAITIPILRPGKIVCAGLNYFEHAREVGKSVPEVPTLFAKFANALTGPTDVIQLTDESDKVDWEVELAIVIGRTVSRASEAEAQSAIFGYTILNDISMRDWQNRTSEWLQGKTFDKTTPIGPVVVTADEFDPERPMAIECHVDGQMKQSGMTDDMVFSPRALVKYISNIMTLEPGDIIATGTPSGVGMARSPQEFLVPGSHVLSRIEGIGELSNVCVAR